MLNDEILEKIFSNREMQTIPIGAQATAVSVFEEILKEVKEENPDATIQQLFSEF